MTNRYYNYDDGILKSGKARPEPIVENFKAIQAAFTQLDADNLDRVFDLLKEVFPSVAEGGAIFSKLWPQVTGAATYSLDMVSYGTHIIPMGLGGDVQIAYEAWPASGTRFATVIFINGGGGVVRWPLAQQWQTSDQLPPALKEVGVDTISVWRDPGIDAALGQEAVFSSGI